MLYVELLQLLNTYETKKDFKSASKLSQNMIRSWGISAHGLQCLKESLLKNGVIK